MLPFANFTYFGFLLVVLVPVVLAGLLGLLNRWWTACALSLLLLVQASDDVAVRPDFHVRELYVILAYTAFQAAVVFGHLRWRSRTAFYAAVSLCIFPLLIAKLIPTLVPNTAFGFLGISYVTFRALDVIFSVHDGLIKELSLSSYVGYLLFVPALSSGPIDRYRRFLKDWGKQRTRAEFLDDLDFGLQRIARGFLYKFIIAVLIKTYLLDPVSSGRSGLVLSGYMYAYTFFLFFDFAGYSAFAIGLGRIFGIHLPENFDRPFLARNIRDFWNRWHISLSFWFRDHVYMRFLLAASKGKWFAGKHTASYLGLFLTFGIMGLWHGMSLHYVIYGLYHASLLSFYDWFARWNKEHKVWGATQWHSVADVFVTFHVVAMGLLLFSGRLTPPPPPAQQQLLEKADSREIFGLMWDAAHPDDAPLVDLVIDEQYVLRIPASVYRKDLEERGYGNGKHGFWFESPWWVRDGNPHTVEVRDAATGKPIQGTPMILVCERDDEEIHREERKRDEAREAAMRELEKKEKESRDIQQKENGGQAPVPPR
jgi:membrane protein involved in D-alanine export